MYGICGCYEEREKRAAGERWGQMCNVQYVVKAPRKLKDSSLHAPGLRTRTGDLTQHYLRSLNNKLIGV